ncbi:MAG: hypothetical protein V4610_19570 [Pseudomonadota bacterium]
MLYSVVVRVGNRDVALLTALILAPLNLQSTKSGRSAADIAIEAPEGGQTGKELKSGRAAQALRLIAGWWVSARKAAEWGAPRLQIFQPRSKSAG